MAKIEWQGTIVSVQPRIRLWRSFDQRGHSYLGYVLQLDGWVGEREDSFLVAIGKAAQAKHQFRVGDEVRGRAEPVLDERKETAAYYKTSGLKLMHRAAEGDSPVPPWQGVAPDLEVYRERGHRRLSASTYRSKCYGCMWGCRMPVEIVIDQWNPGRKRYRFETFCYGPRSCALYKAGPTRKVPGRKGMSWEEEDWVDEEATAHRADDE
jgi:hypothetical protein